MCQPKAETPCRSTRFPGNCPKIVQIASRKVVRMRLCKHGRPADRRKDADYLLQAAIESGTVTRFELMERAGRSSRGRDLRDLGRAWTRCRAVALVLSGPGRNGGDGFVVARLLRLPGCLTVSAFSTMADSGSLPAVCQRRCGEFDGLKCRTASRTSDRGRIRGGECGTSDASGRVIDALIRKIRLHAPFRQTGRGHMQISLNDAAKFSAEDDCLSGGCRTSVIVQRALTCRQQGSALWRWPIRQMPGCSAWPANLTVTFHDVEIRQCGGRRTGGLRARGGEGVTGYERNF